MNIPNIVLDGTYKKIINTFLDLPVGDGVFDQFHNEISGFLHTLEEDENWHYIIYIRDITYNELGHLTYNLNYSKLEYVSSAKPIGETIEDIPDEEQNAE